MTARTFFSDYALRSNQLVVNARIDLYDSGTSNPVTNVFDAQSGGSAVSTVYSDAQGRYGFWSAVPRSLDVVISDNGGLAHYLGQTAPLHFAAAWRQTKYIDPDPNLPNGYWIDVSKAIPERVVDSQNGKLSTDAGVDLSYWGRWDAPARDPIDLLSWLATNRPGIPFMIRFAAGPLWDYHSAPPAGAQVYNIPTPMLADILYQFVGPGQGIQGRQQAMVSIDRVCVLIQDGAGFPANSFLLDGNSSDHLTVQGLAFRNRASGGGGILQGGQCKSFHAEGSAVVGSTYGLVSRSVSTDNARISGINLADNTVNWRITFSGGTSNSPNNVGIDHSRIEGGLRYNILIEAAAASNDNPNAIHIGAGVAIMRQVEVQVGVFGGHAVTLGAGIYQENTALPGPLLLVRSAGDGLAFDPTAPPAQTDQRYWSTNIVVESGSYEHTSSAAFLSKFAGYGVVDIDGCYAFDWQPTYVRGSGKTASGPYVKMGPNCIDCHADLTTAFKGSPLTRYLTADNLYSIDPASAANGCSVLVASL